MAIEVKNEQIAKIDFYFVDGDTRSQTINYARNDITASEIRELQTMIRQGNLLIGDKNQATFGKISKATYMDRVTTTGIEAAIPVGKKKLASELYWISGDERSKSDERNYSTMTSSYNGQRYFIVNGTNRILTVTGKVPANITPTINTTTKVFRYALSGTVQESDKGQDSVTLRFTVQDTNTYESDEIEFVFTNVNTGTATDFSQTYTL